MDWYPADMPRLERRGRDNLAGMSYGSGYDFSKADLDPAFILVADERVEDFGPLVPLLDRIYATGEVENEDGEKRSA